MSTIVAFDVDGTLIDFRDQPQLHVIDTLRHMKKMGCTIIVWSGGGKEYAEAWVRRLFLSEIVDRVMEKPLHLAKLDPDENFCDISFDDEFIQLGKINIKLPTQA